MYHLQAFLFYYTSGKVEDNRSNCCADSKFFEDNTNIATVKLPVLGVNLQNIYSNMEVGDQKLINISVLGDNIEMTLTKKESKNNSSIWDIKGGK